MKRIDWILTAKLITAALILAAALAMLGPAVRFMDSYGRREMQVTADAIDKALVQCFALEGSYPSDITYLVDHYGLILNTDKYVYTMQYEWGGDYMANFKPQVSIFAKEEAVEP